MRTTEERMAHIMEKAKIKERERQRKRRISVLSAVSIALALIFAVNLTLFIPYTVGGTDLSAYKNSEYYPLIKKIDELTSDKRTTNNFKEWGLDFSFGSGENYEEDFPPLEDMGSENQADGNFSDNWGHNNAESTPPQGNADADSDSSWGNGEASDPEPDWGNGEASDPEPDWGNGEESDPGPDWGNGEESDPGPGEEDSRPQEPSNDDEGSSGADTEKPDNEDVTNNQVKGVIEGDLFKRSNDYIYYLRWSSSDWNNTGVNTTRMFLSVYSIQGYESKLVGERIIDPEAGTDFMSYNGQEKEMYLSADSSTITIFSPSHKLTFDEKGNPNPYYYNSKPYTVIISIDVSNPKAPKETTRRYVSGGLVSSRLTNGMFLLVTEFMFNRPDFSKQEEYLPQMGVMGNMRSLPMNDIVLPENATSTRYSILSTFHEKSLERMDSVAFFSGTYAVYVSQENVFTARAYYDTIENGTYGTTMTEITCTSYQNGLNVKGSFSVEGTLLNQYSFDEKDGVLRVFTTSTRNRIYPAYSNQDVYYVPSPLPAPICNLFCVRLSDFEPVATILDFAPERESIRAVRFDGNKAYVCTAVENTDPVFEFDLTNYSNIKIKDTGTISGFSMNLAKFYGNTLLGIGYGDDRQENLKIEIYDSNGTSVTSVAKFELENVDFFTDFKDYFIDRERGLIGFTVYQHLYPSYSYRTAFILLHFNGESLEIVLEGEGYYYGTRACIVDNYIYILDGYSFTVEKIYWG